VRQQELADIEEKFPAVDRTVEEAWRRDTIAAQGGKKGLSSPAPVRRLSFKAFAASMPAPQWSHIGLRPCFIDEDQPRRINPRLIFLPSRPPSGDVRPVLRRERLS